MWIDAICINQLDVLEKNQQVPQMKNIYSPGGARRVVVWLGTIPNARKAIDFCARMEFCIERVQSWLNKCQKKRDARTQYGSKPMLEQPYDDEAAEYAARQLWTYMEVNNYSLDPLKYFMGQAKHYRDWAESDKNMLANVRGRENAEFQEAFLIDSSNAKKTTYEAVRLLWNRMREPSCVQDHDPLQSQQVNDFMSSFVAQYPNTTAIDLLQCLEETAKEPKPGKEVWDLILLNKDTRQAARLLWEQIEEQREWKVDRDLQHELELEYKDEKKACRHLFVDPPWWSRIWILQEVIHSGEVMVLLGQGDSISLSELLNAYSQWKTWKLLQRPREQVLANMRTLRDPSYAFHPIRLTEQEWYNYAFAMGGHDTDLLPRLVELRAAAKASPTPTNTPYPANLSWLVMNFRDQKATDARDMLYALLGMAAPGSAGADIMVDYRVSIRALYTAAARAFLKKVLLVLLMVESSERPIAVDGDLPSWVPDYRTTQNMFPRYQMVTQARFAADAGFPAVEQEPRFRQAPDAETLVLRGLYVGVVTDTLDARFTNEPASAGRDAVRLIAYDRDPTARYKAAAELAAACDTSAWDRPDPVKDSSWGPVHAAVGDYIIIVAGLTMPIVVRRVERASGSESASQEGYLFVGICWLVDSRVKAEVFQTEDWTRDSGFSPVMFGSATRGLPSDWRADEFTLC
jgi:hypothetical protein